MKKASLKSKELQQELMRALQSADDREKDPIELYCSFRHLESRYDDCGISVPEALRHLEIDLERELQATSQGR